MKKTNEDVKAIYKRNYLKTAIILTVVGALLAIFALIYVCGILFDFISLPNLNNDKVSIADGIASIFVLFSYSILAILYIMIAIITVVFLLESIIFYICGLKKSMNKKIIIPCIAICGCLLIAVLVCSGIGLSLFVR